MEFIDRVSAYPNRHLLIEADGSQRYVVLERADEPVTVGTPLNAETFNPILEDIEKGKMLIVTINDGEEVASHNATQIYEHVQNGGTAMLYSEEHRAWFHLSQCNEGSASFTFVDVLDAIFRQYVIYGDGVFGYEWLEVNPSEPIHVLFDFVNETADIGAATIRIHVEAGRTVTAGNATETYVFAGANHEAGNVVFTRIDAISGVLRVITVWNNKSLDINEYQLNSI